MKRLLAGLAAIILLSGCSTPPEAGETNTSAADRSGIYAVQIVEVKIPADKMANLHSELYWNPDQEQITGINASSVQDLFSPANGLPSYEPDKTRHINLPRPKIAQDTIDRILAMPEADTYEYPVLYARPGEAVICDRTESKEMLEDVNVIDGQTIKTMKTVKLGHYAEITIQHETESGLSCSLEMENKSLADSEIYTLENGDQIEMPFFDSFSINCASWPLNETWSMHVLSIGESTQNGITSGTSHLVFMRVLPQEI